MRQREYPQKLKAYTDKNRFIITILQTSAAFIRKYIIALRYTRYTVFFMFLIQSSAHAIYRHK